MRKSKFKLTLTHLETLLTVLQVVLMAAGMAVTVSPRSKKGIRKP